MDGNLEQYFILAGIFCYLAFVIWGAWSFLKGLGEAFRQNSFEKRVRQALNNGEPTWDDIRHLQLDASITLDQCHSVLNSIKSEQIVGGETGSKRVLIEHYISSLDNDEPFEGIPDSIRVHLIATQDQVANAGTLNAVAQGIRGLIRANDRDSRFQKWCTIGGFFIGLVSFLVAVYQIT